MTKQILHCTFTLRMIEYKIYQNFEMFLISSARVVMLQCITKYFLHQTDKEVKCFIALKYVLDGKLYVKSCNKLSEMRAKLASDKSNGLPPKIIHSIVNNVSFL